MTQAEEALDEMAEMMDPDDVAFLKAQSRRSNGKRKHGDNDSESENDLEINALEKRAKVNAYQEAEDEGDKKDLLPIRTKQGWVQRSAKVEHQADEEEEEDAEVGDDTNGAHEESEDTDEEEQEDIKGQEFSVIELLAKRREFIAEKKTEIGSMASNFLELPHERVTVLEKLVKMVSSKESQGTIIILFSIYSISFS